MMQPAAINGAVENAYSSAPSSAATRTSRPVRSAPSTCSRTRPRRSFATSTCCVSAMPSSQGSPACLSDDARRRARAAVVSGDHDVVGLRLGDAGRDRADAGLGHELDADRGAPVDRAQVVDQLREILDRVDVVVRRRRDQADSGRRVPEPGDLIVDLEAGQLAALAGLRALGDLDLQLVGVDEVAGRHAEPRRGDLLDRRAAQVAVRVGRRAHGILAALAGVRARAEAVHGDREGLVGLARDRAERHRTRREATHDLAGRLDLRERDRLTGRHQLEQAAKRRRLRRGLVDRAPSTPGRSGSSRRARRAAASR